MANLSGAANYSPNTMPQAEMPEAARVLMRLDSINHRLITQSDALAEIISKISGPSLNAVHGAKENPSLVGFLPTAHDALDRAERIVDQLGERISKLHNLF